jgi:poly(hydroxyalkanoate) depolymerase family esterase
VVALHGCTQTASDFAAGTRFDSVAERAGAYVVYPEQSVLRNGNRCWNWYEEANQHRDGAEPAAILALVDDLCSRLPVDRERVFLAGLSAGGAMAAILAEQAPDVFAAAGIMAGVRLHASYDLSSARAAMHGPIAVPRERPLHADLRGPGRFRRMRATVWTGTNDRTVDPSNATALARQFIGLLALPNADGEREDSGAAEIARWRDATGRVRVECWNVRHMGHAWSGGSFRGSHTYPAGPSASDAMMQFFLEGSPPEEARGV